MGGGKRDYGTLLDSGICGREKVKQNRRKSLNDAMSNLIDFFCVKLLLKI